MAIVARIFRCLFVAATLIAIELLWLQAYTLDPRTTMFIASETGNIADLERSISAGAKIEWRDEQGLTPIMIAARSGRIETVRRLIAAGADLKVSSPYFGTALSMAEGNGHEEVVKLLRSADKHPTT